MKKLKYEEISLNNGATVTHATLETNMATKVLNRFKIAMLLFILTMVAFSFYS